MTKPIMLLGAHMSIAGGVENAIYAGHSIGCTAIQIFTGSNRQWNLKSFTKEAIEKFKEAQKQYSIDVIAHSSYLINLGSNSLEIYKKSIDALRSEVERCEQLSINYLVLHPGSGAKEKQVTLAQIIKGLKEVIEQTNKTTILLENTAGQGNVVGHTLEQLNQILEPLNYTKRIGICFDTCHAFASGYDFSNSDKYNALWDRFDKIIGLNHLKAIHLNDSLKPLNSNVDRHEDIGKGKIGLEAFSLIINDERFFSVPKILETPKDTGLERDKINLETLKHLIKPETYKKIRTQ